MAERNSSYWKERMAAIEDAGYQSGAAYYKDVQKQYRMAVKGITRDMEVWYQRLADNNEISYAGAKRLLKKNELEEFHWTVEQYIKAGKENAVDQRWMKELENVSAKYHISRLEAMKLQLQQQAEVLSAQMEQGMTDFLHKSYGDQYYRTAFEIAKGTGVGSNLAKLDHRRTDLLLKKPWARDGKNFSDRIWTNKKKLVNNLHTELTQSIIRGEAPGKAIDRLSKAMNVSKSQAGNLIMTETAAISSRAQQDCFKELGIEEFEVVETLDGSTCEFCQEMDGKHFPMSDYRVGETAPPFHPRCRGCTCPYFDDEFSGLGERAARDPEEGKTYTVPENMTYQEWHTEFIEKDPKKALAEKKLRNQKADKEQYERYKKVLGKDAPDLLDSFQEMKYTESKKYSFLELDYSRRNKLARCPELKLPGAENATAADAKFTKYLFGGRHPEGLAKGRAFESRLGYSIDNWQELQREIVRRAQKYPSEFKGNNGHGKDMYEQKIIMYGSKNTPANVIIGWAVDANRTTMASAYIKEVK